MAFDISDFVKQDLQTLRNKLARIKRDKAETWGADHIGRYTDEERAAVISRTEAQIADFAAGRS